ncbi:MAG: cytochrome c peroxidase [Bacteroidota bacterium]
MKFSLTTALGTLVCLFVLSSCLKDEVDVRVTHYTDEELQTLQQYLTLPSYRDNYAVELAEHLKNIGATPPVLNDAKATLGRVLFYDTKLSLTQETSCASCHDQALAFSDNKAFSEGINGQFTKRNSLPLASAANFQASYDTGPSFGRSIGFFWDERATTISGQSELTIEDDIEMGMDLDELTVRLSNEDYYQILFRKAYGDEVVTKQRILSAIEEFVNAFVSTSSPFDEGMNNAGSVHQEFDNFTIQENRGKELFLNNCASCHASDMSSPIGQSVANNGLDLVYEDKGMGELAGETSLNGVFKVPFLRNIELTGPYMHDGRFETLEEVIEHYSTGIQDHPNLSPQLKTLAGGEPRQFFFTEQEKSDLVAFLKTVTDPSFAEDVRYSDPFKQ